MEDHWRDLAPLPFKDPEFPGTRPPTAILIRARSVVQVHPGPPFKSPIYTRRFSLSPSWGLIIKKPFCQKFAKSSVCYTLPVIRGHRERLSELGMNSAHQYTAPSRFPRFRQRNREHVAGIASDDQPGPNSAARSGCTDLMAPVPSCCRAKILLT